jgi:hypothetical protein
MSGLKDCGPVSKLEFPLPLWRYLLLFQSWRQLQSWIIIVVGTVLLIYGAIKSIGALLLPIEGVLVGMTFGSIFAVVMVIPAEFYVVRRTERLTGLLANQLNQVGYVQASQTAKVIIYKQNLPRFLRWDEGDVSIEECGDKVVVKGALFILANLRRSMQKEYF